MVFKKRAFCIFCFNDRALLFLLSLVFSLALILRTLLARSVNSTYKFPCNNVHATMVAHICVNSCVSPNSSHSAMMMIEMPDRSTLIIMFAHYSLAVLPGTIQLYFQPKRYTDFAVMSGKGQLQTTIEQMVLLTVCNYYFTAER